MRRFARSIFLAAAALTPFGQGAAQPGDAKPPAPGPERPLGAEAYAGGGAAPGALLRVFVTGLFPGAIPVRPDVRNPFSDDPASAERGMRFFASFNCSGCHAANGGGGMGPSLSNAKFIYGDSAAQIYVTILQGRPNGMPAWGAALPDQVIWDLVSYVQSISRKAPAPWGKTTSLQTFETEQVPFTKTVEPWSRTQPFSFGRRP